MDPNEILTRILRRYGTLTDQIRATQIIESKISKRIATYADADEMALRIGQALTKALKENLPDALTDGMLFRAVAEVVVERPLKVAGADVSRIAAEIQQELNDAAGIGIRPIVPEMNQDQIDGIITGICNAESFEAGADTMFSRLENCLEGYVDDFVRENADFQYRAGLSPKIERRAMGKCCAWCSRLAGTYEYADVSDRGNDVFRRHKNCHCIVNYVPANGAKRRQNVHTKRWTKDDETELRERRIHFGERRDFEHDYSRIRAQKIENYRENNLYLDQNANLSPRQIRRINDQITQAKELLGVTGQCNSNMVIVKESNVLAAYNPRTDTFFINSSLSDRKKQLQIQNDYACASDPRSTMVHELFHWKDAEHYRQNVGKISDATSRSAYSIYQRERAISLLAETGIDIADGKAAENISNYAKRCWLDNDFEEVYTEFRTAEILKGGASR